MVKWIDGSPVKGHEYGIVGGENYVKEEGRYFVTLELDKRYQVYLMAKKVISNDTLRLFYHKK